LVSLLAFFDEDECGREEVAAQATPCISAKVERAEAKLLCAFLTFLDPKFEDAVFVESREVVDDAASMFVGLGWVVRLRQSESSRAKVIFIRDRRKAVFRS